MTSDNLRIRLYSQCVIIRLNSHQNTQKASLQFIHVFGTELTNYLIFTNLKTALQKVRRVRNYTLQQSALHTNACLNSRWFKRTTIFILLALAFLLFDWIFRTTAASQTFALVILQIVTAHCIDNGKEQLKLPLRRAAK